MTCTGSTVAPTQKIIIGDVAHAGLVTHKCSLEPKNHDQVDGKEICQCACGHRWLKNF